MGDRVADAVAELYAGPLEDFTPRRTALAKDARAAKDRDAATQIGALRKPTRAAFTVNQFARAHPERIAELLELGTDLREAERSLDGPAMRELSGRRRSLVEDLAAAAFALIEEADPATALQEDVVATWNAAVADEEIGGAVAAGALVKPVHWEGFGSVALADVLATPDAVGASAPPTGRATPPTRRGKGGTAGSDGPADAPPADEHGHGDEPAGPSTQGRKQRREDAAERRSVRDADRDRAVRAAEREAAIAERRRAQREEIESARAAAADAQAAVRAAHQAVDDRTAEVRTVQEHLAQARNRLDDARFAVRRAEIDEQKAAQALDRLTRRAR